MDVPGSYLKASKPQSVQPVPLASATTYPPHRRADQGDQEEPQEVFGSIREQGSSAFDSRFQGQETFY